MLTESIIDLIIIVTQGWMLLVGLNSPLADGEGHNRDVRNQDKRHKQIVCWQPTLASSECSSDYAKYRVWNRSCHTCVEHQVDFYKNKNYISVAANFELIGDGRSAWEARTPLRGGGLSLAERKRGGALGADCRSARVQFEWRSSRRSCVLKATRINLDADLKVIH